MPKLKEFKPRLNDYDKLPLRMGFDTASAFIGVAAGTLKMWVKQKRIPKPSVRSEFCGAQYTKQQVLTLREHIHIGKPLPDNFDALGHAGSDGELS